MNKKILRKISDAIMGKRTANDCESYKLALADGIVGALKDNDFIIKANQLIIGCENGCYEEVMEESKSDIIKCLKNQGGAIRSLAGRIESEDGIQVRVSPAPENVDVKHIPAGILPTEVWFYLKKADLTTHLILFRNNWSVALDPRKRYTVGRSTESRDTTIMLTIPDADKFISRWQAEIACIDGVWYCKSISENCPTFVDDRFAEGDVPFPLGKPKVGGQIKFGVNSPGYVLQYSMDNTSQSMIQPNAE